MQTKIILVFCSGIWRASHKKKIIKAEEDEICGLWRFTKLTKWFNLAFLRFSTCEDFIKRSTNKTIFQIKRVPSKIIPHIWSLRNESVKIGTGPLEGHFKTIHYGLIIFNTVHCT